MDKLTTSEIYIPETKVKLRFLSSHSLGVMSFEEGTTLAQLPTFQKQQNDNSPYESISALSTSALKLPRNAVRAASSSLSRLGYSVFGRSPMLRPNSLLLFLISLAVLCVPLHAQTVDTAIIGTVTDHSGAVISGAKVTVTSASTGIAKSAVTASTGEYTINYLLPGSYDVAVTANGFTTTRQQGIEVQLSQEARVNFQLQVGTATEQVTVEGAQPLLQTQASSLGIVVGQEETQNLPLNGRKFEDLAILMPGTTAYDPDNHTSTEDGASVQS